MLLVDEGLVRVPRYGLSQVSFGRSSQRRSVWAPIRPMNGVPWREISMAEPKKAVPAARRTSPGVIKPAAKSRRRSVKKAAGVPQGGTSGRSLDGGPESPGRRESARQAEKLAIPALAIVLGLIGLAVYVLWLAAIVLMAVLFGLIASELKVRTGGGGVVPGVVTTMVVEAKSVAEDVAESGTARGRD